MILSISNGKQSAAAAVPEKIDPLQVTTNDKNILASDATLRGSIEFDGELLVEGAVEGKIISDSGDVTIGNRANVSADIESANANIEGEVRGNVKLKEKCILTNGSVLVGDLVSTVVELENGAVFWGKSQIGTKPASAKTK